MSNDTKWSRTDNGLWWRRVGDYVQMCSGGNEPPPDDWAPPEIQASAEGTYEILPEGEG
jgi:hypothetical protein